MHIALGADHAGFELKQKVKEELQKMGHDVEDLGTVSNESVDYPDFAAGVAERVARGKAERGILVCGTGMGMAMAANKVPGIRAASLTSLEEARLSREHNDANVLALGGRVLDGDRAVEIVRTWINTEFAGGRHQRRIDKISELEKKYHDDPGSH